ncbi:hypothetical protein [Actinocorallia longicatena]
MAGLLATGCSGDKDETGPSPSPSTGPSGTPPPVFTLEQVETALLTRGDYGKNWAVPAPERRRTSLVKKQIETCTYGKLDPPGTPQFAAQQYSEKSGRLDGGNRSELIMVYPTAEEASGAFARTQEKLKDCRPKKRVPPSPIPSSTRFLASFDATWTPTEEPIGEWRRSGGLQKGVYSTYIKHNIAYTFFDYALRGNVLVSSIYWQATEPRTKVDPIKKRAEELLTKQLERIG